MLSIPDSHHSPRARRKLPASKEARALLAEISLGILVMKDDNFIENFATATGEALGADMVLISRIKSKDILVETYAFYDRSGENDHYTYMISGTPCEIVFDDAKPFAINEDVAGSFPKDKDLEELGLHAYAGVPLFDSDGQRIGLIAALWATPRDNLDLEITALEYFAPPLAATMLQIEAQKHNELIVAGASSGTWYMDFEGSVEYFSTAARRILGQPDMPAKARRNTALKGLSPEDRRIVTAAFDAFRRGEAPLDVNFRSLPKQGQPRWLRMTGKAEHNAQGRITAIAGDLTDISELVEARRTAEAASRAKSDFLATMSHEIRTPMNGILGMASLLSEADIPEEQKRQAGIIKKSGEAMMVILNDVLDLSKVEAGKLDLEQRNFSPRELVEDVAMLWRNTIEKKGLEFTLNVCEPLPDMVCADDTRLRQVLSNLLSNALKFTQAGSIGLHLEAKNDADNLKLKFTVSDTGIGIAKAQQNRLFSAFGQANSSISRRFGGTGLGLAISDKIVRLMGGCFEITSESTKGSAFCFTINAHHTAQTTSCATAADQSQNTASAKPDDTKIEYQTQGKRSILIAEDNEINRSVLRAFLSRLPVELIFVENGAKAVELASARPFDIILMDIQMPILDGISATQKIRAGDGPCCTTPIIALTANAMPGDRQRFIDAGMSGYVSKPIDLRTLFEALKESGGLDKKQPAADKQSRLA